MDANRTLQGVRKVSKYIKVDDLQRYCDNQKNHSITPNEFQRMNHYDFGLHTGTPTEEGLYAVYYLDDNNPSATPYEVLYDGFLSPDGEGNWIDRDGERRFIDDDIVRWQKITPFEPDKEN